MIGSWFLVAAIVVVIVEVNVMVWATSIIDKIVAVEVLVIDVLTDVDIIVVGVIIVPIAYSVDVPSGAAVNLFMDALASVMIVGLAWNGVEVLTADVVTVLGFPVPTPVEDFSR